MSDKVATPPIPTLEDMQHWTEVMGRAQQLMLEHAGGEMAKAAGESKPGAGLWPNLFPDPAEIAKAQVELWTQGMSAWQNMLGSYTRPAELEEKAAADKRFAAPEWRKHPVFDLIRQTYVLVSER